MPTEDINPIQKRLEEADRKLERIAPTTKIRMAKQFQQDPFWLKVFRPALEVVLLHSYEALRRVPLSEIKVTRGRMDAIDTILEYPEQAIENAKTELEVRRHQKEQEQEDAEPAETDHGLAP